MLCFCSWDYFNYKLNQNLLMEQNQAAKQHWTAQATQSRNSDGTPSCPDCPCASAVCSITALLSLPACCACQHPAAPCPMCSLVSGGIKGLGNWGCAESYRLRQILSLTHLAGKFKDRAWKKCEKIISLCPVVAIHSLSVQPWCLRPPFWTVKLKRRQQAIIYRHI